jgi:threonine aldolase
MYGGGFRQAGIIAAGALYGLEHHRERLVADHDNARRFADSVVEIPNVEIDLASVHTNIVYFFVAASDEVVDRCATDGVAMLAMGPTRVRAVFHLDVSEDDTNRAIEVVTKVMTRSQ